MAGRREDEVLNPTLYRLLQLHFGDVDVANNGQALVWSDPAMSVRARKLSEGDGHPLRRVLASGEEYRVNCPFCGDNRKRLYINHMWAVYDDSMEALNLWLCRCFNEECMEEHHNRIRLHEWVFSPAGSRQNGRIEVRPGSTDARRVGQVSPPGPVIPLAELPESHPACRFIAGRGFDPKFLSKRYGVGYCSDSHYSLASNRIIIPVREGGQLVGWQARYIGDPPNRKTPKYWTCPGMPRRLLAYNWESAVEHHTVVLVEGPTDVWQFGPQAMGVFGKTMNQMLVDKTLDRLKLTNGGEHTAVILLDPEQDPEEAMAGKPHHIEKLESQLVGLVEEGMDLLPVYLPKGLDPGSAGRKFMRNLIRERAAESGIHVNFGKPKRMFHAH